jgi:precorrin-6A synthase
MRTVLLIGIGAGDPDQVTVQAVKALNRVDVFFVLDKGEAKKELVDVRQEILARHITGHGYRVVEGRDPDRDRSAAVTADAGRYASAVDDWRRRRADVCEQLIREELGEDETGAFLVWGDPTLYDSTLGIVEDILGRGTVAFEYAVIPGISSPSALVAGHRVGLNRVGRPVLVTTGRRLADEGMPADDVVVMLDAHNAFLGLDPDDAARTDIYWGAYLGMPDEMLVAGPVTEVGAEIAARRAAVRERKGWIMDTYLLRRRPPPSNAHSSTP